MQAFAAKSRKAMLAQTPSIREKNLKSYYDTANRTIFAKNFQHPWHSRRHKCPPFHRQVEIRRPRTNHAARLSTQVSTAKIQITSDTPAHTATQTARIAGKTQKNRTPFGVRELCQTNSIGILVHRPQAPGADIRPLDLAALADKLDLLNVGAPSPSVFTVRVADLVAAQTTFSADTANFRHRR